MAKKQAPFAWIFGRYAGWVGVAGLVITAAWFRLLALTILPPGLYSGEAVVGLDAAKLADHAWLPGLTAANGYAPLWIWLQAIPVRLLGHTAFALRIWPALLGILTVVLLWLWARDWFGARIAWFAAFVVAVSPWAVTVSRNALPTVLYPFLVCFIYWAGTKAYRSGNLTWWLLSGLGVVAALLSGPVGWLIALLAVAHAFWLLLGGRQFSATRPHLVAAAVVAIGLVALGYLASISSAALAKLPNLIGLVHSPAQFADTALRTLLMFNIRGDENFRHNFAAEPLLNVFVGLMFITGLLVAISRYNKRTYQALLALLVVLMLPAFASTVGAPNAAHAAPAIPAVALLAAIGISYMLELWYATFPINSAARTLGQATIIILLGLTLFQGYTQYFRAWAASSETFSAYNEGANAMSRFLSNGGDKFKDTKIVIATEDEASVIRYLTPESVNYSLVQAAQLAALPVTPGARQFIISAASRDAAVATMKQKFPGGVLRPNLSGFNQSEIYYVYEVAK